LQAELAKARAEAKRRAKEMRDTTKKGDERLDEEEEGEGEEKV